MKFHEEIYTSAPELLDSSATGDLGVVARSKGFPADVQRELEFVRSYHILDSIPLSEAKRHPPRWVCALRGKRRDHYCISRIVFAGADHTSRTTPLAHHLVFGREEMNRNQLSPASLLGQVEPCFRAKWQESPKWIDPLREFRSTDHSPDSETFASPLWQQSLSRPKRTELLAAITERLLKFPQDRKPVVCLLEIEKAKFAAQWMANILRLLPASSQWEQVCASHVISTADLPSDASLILSYPGTPFAKECAERRDPRAPYLFDLTNAESIAAPRLEGYGTVLGKILASTDSPARAEQAGKLYDFFGMDTEDLSSFPQVWQLLHDLSDVTESAELASYAARLPEISNISATAERNFSRWCCEKLIDKQLLSFPEENNRWDAVATIVKQEAWPLEVRNHALNLINRDPRSALPRLIRSVESSSSLGQDLQPVLRKLREQHPELVSQLIDDAAAGDPDAEVTAAWLAGITPVEATDVVAWANHSLSKMESLPDFLKHPLAEYLRVAIRRITESSPEVQMRVFATVLPLLQHLTRRAATPVVQWDDSVRCYLQIVVDPRLPWLTEIFREELTLQRLHAWVENSGAEGPRLHQALLSAQLLAAQSPNPAERADSPVAGAGVADPPSWQPEVTPSADPLRTDWENEPDESSSQGFPPRIVPLLLGFCSLLFYAGLCGIRWHQGELRLAAVNKLFANLPEWLAAGIVALAVLLAAACGLILASWGLNSLLRFILNRICPPTSEPLQHVRRLNWMLAILVGLAALLLTACFLAFSWMHPPLVIVLLVGLVSILWQADILVRNRSPDTETSGLRWTRLKSLLPSVILLTQSTGLVVQLIQTVSHPPT